MSYVLDNADNRLLTPEANIDMTAEKHAIHLRPSQCSRKESP